MPNYPKTIKAGTFAGLAEKSFLRSVRYPLVLQRGVSGTTFQNERDIIECGITALQVKNDAANKKTSDAGLTSADRPGDLDQASTLRLNFAPLQDNLAIRCALKNPQVITELELQLHYDVNGRAAVAWTKKFKFTAGSCPGKFETIFNGDLASTPPRGAETDPTQGGAAGATSVSVSSKPGMFPDDVLTIEYSPYLIRVEITNVVAGAKANPVSRWVFLDVIARIKNLRWGDPQMIPTTRDDTDMSSGRNAPALVEEKAILNRLRAATTGAVPQYALGAGNYEILIPTPVFKTVQNKTEDPDHTDFEETTKYWGLGPRLPVLADVVILKTDGSEVSVPQALGNAKFLWDWEDVDDPTANPKWQNWLDPGYDDRCKNFVKGVINNNADPADPLVSDNCPVALGGKRGAGGAAVFLNTDGYDPGGALQNGAFPFRVDHSATTRTWAGLSLAWRGGILSGSTGVLLQPSRMAGDKYKITVFLYYDQSLDCVTKCKDLRTGLQAGDWATSGYLEVFRGFDVTCIKRGTIPDLNWPGIKTKYKTEIGHVLNVVPAALDDTDFNAILDLVCTDLRKDRNSVTAYKHLPLFFDHGIDFAPPANSPALPFRDLNVFQTNVTAAFWTKRVYRLRVASAPSFLFEDVMSTAAAKGIVVKKDAQYIWILPTNLTAFAAGDSVRGPASGAQGTIDEVWGSFWESEIVEANSTKSREVKVTTPAGTETVSFLPFEKKIGDKTKRRLSALLNKCGLERPIAEKLTVTLSCKESDNDDKARRANVKTYVQSLIDPATGPIVDRQALVNSIINSAILAKFYPQGENYQRIVFALLEPLLRKYIEQTYPAGTGVYLFHLPGRDTQFKVKSTGGYFPESSGRNRGLAYVGIWNGGGYLTNRPDGSVINYKVDDAVTAHEVGHAVFIPHALHATGRKPPSPLKPQLHVVGSTCIMNYDSDSEHFCGFCMFRLRGWDWNPANLTRFAVKNVRITNVGLQSKAYSLDFEAYTPPVGGDDTFHFAPNAETAKIRYTIEDPDGGIASGKLNLYRMRDGQLLWSRPLLPAEYANGDVEIDWNGLTAGAGAYFGAGNFITAEHSPYKLEITVDGEGFADPPIGWTQFEVQIAAAEFEFGPKAVLAASPVQGTTAAQLGGPGLQRDHQVWEYLDSNEVPPPYAYLGATGVTNLTNQVPKPGETKKVYLVSNVFYTDVAQQTTNACYTQLQAAWGDGPNIPIFLKILTKKSDDTTVLEPLALGDVKCLWDWEDATEEVEGDPTIDQGSINAAMPAALNKRAVELNRPVNQLSANAQQSVLDDVTAKLKDEYQGYATPSREYVASAMNYTPASVPPGLCCHADRGGKRGLPGAEFFPAQADPGNPAPGPGIFPFEVSHTIATNRPWAAVSSVQAAGTYQSKTGVVFQPPAIAGDAYTLTACLYFPHELPLANVADITGGNAPKTRLDATRVAASGTFEIWREVHIAKYYKKKPGLIGGTQVSKDMDFTVVQQFMNPAFIRVRGGAVQAMVQATFDNALQQVIADGLAIAPPPHAIPKVIAHAMNHAGNWAAGNYLIHFRDHANYQVQLNPAAMAANAGMLPPPADPYWDNLLPGVFDPYNPASSVWTGDTYRTARTYEDKTKLDWSRQAAVRLLDKYIQTGGVNPPDGIYIVQGDGMSQFGSDCVAFGGHFLPGVPNRCVFLYAKYNSNCVMEESSSHEFGHCLFLNHCHDRKGDPLQYHNAPNCLMSYNFNNRFLCGACSLRLRGWSLYQVNPGGATLEPVGAPARNPDTGRTLCATPGNNPTDHAAPSKTVPRKVYT